MFSQTAEYALRAVMFIAGADGVPANSERISAGMHVPRPYLSKILRDLVVAKIVESLLGPNGGFVMARPINKVTVLDVINAVDPLRRITECPLGRADHVKLCPLHSQMDAAIAHVECTLKGVTIEQLRQQDNAGGTLAMVRPNANAKPPAKPRVKVRS